MRRKFAMIDAVRQKKAASKDGLVSRFKCRLPFPVEPSEMNAKFIAGPAEGERHVHVDMCERKRVRHQKVHRVNKKALLRSPNSNHPQIEHSMIP